MTPDERSALAGWLATQGHALVPGSAITPLYGGLANRNERIELESGPAVLRRPPPGVLASGASDMGREHRVMAALAPHWPLVPKPLAFCADESVLGTPFLVIEHRTGVAIGGTLPPGTSSHTGGVLVAETLKAMFALHRIDPDAIGLGDLGKPEGFYQRQLAGWTRRAAAVWPDGLPPECAALIAALEAVPLPIDPGAPVLLHMDLKPDNLLVDPATMIPQAIVDWDMATRGPPAFDLAILLSYWIEPGDPVALHALDVLPSLTPDWPDRAGLCQLYELFGSQRHGPLVWPVALARLRLGVAWGQLWRKWQRGELAGDRYAGFETLAPAIFDHALTRFAKDSL